MRDVIESALTELGLRGANVDVATFVQQNLAVQTTQRRALVSADNRSAETAGWDDAMLRIELAAFCVGTLVERGEGLLDEACTFFQYRIGQFGGDIVTAGKRCIERLDVEHVVQYEAQIGERGVVAIHSVVPVARSAQHAGQARHGPELAFEGELVAAAIRLGADQGAVECVIHASARLQRGLSGDGEHARAFDR